MKLIPITNFPIDKKIQKFLSVPFLHKASLHPQKFVLLGGSPFVLIGLANISLSVGQRNLGIVIGIIGMLFNFGVLAWLLYPCKCGQEYNLTALSKRVIQNQTSKSFFVSIFIGTIVSVPLTFLLVSNIDKIVPFCGYSLTFIGLFYLLDALSGNRLSQLCRLSVSHERTQHIIALKGETLDELNDLFNYYIDTGNYEEADRISKLSLKLAEGKNLD